jgi:succinate dehydrogenase/fumarate reductase flavoprotein subunit
MSSLRLRPLQVWKRDQCLRHGVRFYSEHHVLSLVFDEGRCVGVVTYDPAEDGNKRR